MFLTAQKNYSFISIDTPLISNLNMVENIALIQEFHQLLSINKAESIAYKQLEKIQLSHISTNRLHECSSLEIFYVMFIRALMTQEMDVIICSPLLLIGELQNMKNVINTLIFLNERKNILILDTQTNEIHYEGCLCHIAK